MANLTTRETFAGVAMSALIQKNGDTDPKVVADISIEYADALMRALGSKTEPARGGYGAPAPSSPRDRRGVEPMKIPFGRNKDQMTDDPSIPLKDLEWLADAVTTSIQDRSKARFKGPNQRLLEAIQSAILDRESGPDTGSYNDPQGPTGDDDIPF